MTTKVCVVGGGPNGLAAAVVLAREGCEVTVLDAAPGFGGTSAGGELHPGYRHAGLLHDTGLLRPFVRVATELDRHGLALRPAPATHVPGAGPAAPFPALPATVRPIVQSVLDEPVPALGPDAPLWPLIKRAFAARRLGGEVLTELMRVGVLAAEDWLAEFEPDPVRRAAHALPALLGAYMGPRSPHSAGLLLLGRSLGGEEVVGGAAGLAAALQQAAVAWRVTLRADARVDAVLVDRHAVRGVRLASGEELRADVVLAAIDPKTLVTKLLPPGTFPPVVEDQALHVRTRVTHAVVHLAWSAYPAFADGAAPAERYAVVRDPRALERAFDDARHGRMPADPALWVSVPTLGGGGAAPPGHHVATVQVFGAPGALRGGWTPDRERELLDRVLDALARHQPGVRDVTVAHEVVTAPTIEARYGLAGGHLWHGERALDTLWVGRPGPGLCRHSTPVRGLFLASPGVHPGTGGVGASGVMAARAALEGR